MGFGTSVSLTSREREKKCYPQIEIWEKIMCDAIIAINLIPLDDYEP